MSTFNNTKLSTIIVNWNTRDLLRTCLRTLINTTGVSQQIWVVDNASSDGSAEMVRREFPTVNLLANPNNQGFAAANNLGIHAARPSEFILLLNPDTEVLDGSVDAMVNYLAQHPEVGAVGVQLLNPDGTKQRSYDYFYNFIASFWRNLLVKKLFKLVPGTVEQANSDELEVDWLIGACVMLRTEALDAIGLLDESFFMYGEEVDLQHRLRKAGWKIYMLPQVHLIHYGGQSSKQASLKMMVQEYRSRYLLIRKHNSIVTLSLYLIKAWLALVFWCSYWGVKALIRRDDTTRQWFKSYCHLLSRHLQLGFYRWPTSATNHVTVNKMVN